jgi:hypothetical protein
VLPFEAFLEDILPTLPENWSDLLPKMNILSLYENTVEVAFSYDIIAPPSLLARKSNFVTLVFHVITPRQNELVTELLKHQVCLSELRMKISYFSNSLRNAISANDTLTELSLSMFVCLFVVFFDFCSLFCEVPFFVCFLLPVYLNTNSELPQSFPVEPLFTATRANMRALNLTFIESDVSFVIDIEEVVHCPNLTSLYINGVSRKNISYVT